MSFADEIDDIKKKQEEDAKSELEKWYKSHLTTKIKNCCLKTNLHSLEGWIQVGTPREQISIAEPYFNVIDKNLRIITPKDVSDFINDNYFHNRPDTTFYGYGGCGDLNFERAVQITKAVIAELGFKDYSVKTEVPVLKGLFKKKLISNYEIYIRLKW